MKKLFSTIIVFGLLWGGSAYAWKVTSWKVVEVIGKPVYADPKIACRILAPFISAKCLDVKIVLFTLGFSGSMPPYSQTNIYGVYELKNKSRIVLPLSFDVTLP